MHRNKPQFNRLLELDRQIRDGKYPNCLTFSVDWEVSQKTVQRDIEYLRDTLGAPIEYHREKRGFFYTDANWFLPSLSMSEGDLFYLLLASKVLEQYRGTPVAAHVERIFGKVASLLPDKLALKPELVFTRFSFTSPPSGPVHEDIWTTLVRGLLHQQSVEIAYRRLEAHESGSRTIDPYHIANLQGEWYVFAWCHTRQMVLQFAMSRIGEAVLTKTPFEIQSGFDRKKLASGTFARFTPATGDKAQTVSLLFDKTIAPQILEKQWGPGQRARRRKNGDIELSFQATGLLEVQRWVLAWGRQVRVLAPRELKRMVREEIRFMHKAQCG